MASPDTPAIAADDRWKLTLKTPMGEQNVTLAITGVAPGTFTGVMIGDDGENPIKDAKASGGKLSWKIDRTKPMKLTFKFDVELTGDALAGTFKAGIFPASQVTGVRG